MALRDRTNRELFQLYDTDLVLRLHNIKNLRDTRTLLSHFEDFLGERPISPEVAKGFLAQYADRMPRTLYRYAQMIKAFMKWYGEPLDDIRIRIPKTLPPTLRTMILKSYSMLWVKKEATKVLLYGIG